MSLFLTFYQEGEKRGERGGRVGGSRKAVGVEEENETGKEEVFFYVSRVIVNDFSNRCVMTQRKHVNVFYYTLVFTPR